MADRDAILDSAFADDGMEDACREITTKPYKAVQNAMDTYMRETCLELLEYMAKNEVSCEVNMAKEKRFYFKGQWISKEELFENFL